jgi:segregation and condensation protein B
MEELELQPQGGTSEPGQEPPHAPPQTVSIEEWLESGQPGVEEAPRAAMLADAQLMAVLEACVYVAEEPLMPAQIAAALDQDPERIRTLLERLVAEFDRPEHGVTIKEVAGGYKMATKPEHHEAVRNFVKTLKSPLKLSLPALETLAVIAYKQPVTTPEIMEIRGVQGGGVLKTLLDRKLITEAGRKNVIGKPILFKTTREFLIQFGLKDLSELPSLKEFEEIRRMALADSEIPGEAAASGAAPPPGAEGGVAEPSAVDAEAAPNESHARDAEGAAAEPRAVAPEAADSPTDAAAPDDSHAQDGEAAIAEAPAAAPDAEGPAAEPLAAEADAADSPDAAAAPDESEAAIAEAPAAAPDAEGPAAEPLAAEADAADSPDAAAAADESEAAIAEAPAVAPEAADSPTEAAAPDDSHAQDGEAAIAESPAAAPDVEGPAAEPLAAEADAAHDTAPGVATPIENQDQ